VLLKNVSNDNSVGSVGVSQPGFHVAGIPFHCGTADGYDSPVSES